MEAQPGATGPSRPLGMAAVTGRPSAAGREGSQLTNSVLRLLRSNTLAGGGDGARQVAARTLCPSVTGVQPPPPPLHGLLSPLCVDAPLPGTPGDSSLEMGHTQNLALSVDRPL